MARFGWLILLLLFGALFSPHAFAFEYPDQGTAAAGCAATGAQAGGDTLRNATGNYKCSLNMPGVYACSYEVKYERVEIRWINCGNHVPGGEFHNYPAEKSCAAKSDYSGTGPWSSSGGSARSGSLGCREGCDGIWFKNADSTFTWTPTGDACPEDEKKNCQAMGEGYYWNPALAVCEPPSGECKEGGKPNSLGQCAPEPCPSGMIQQADGTCKKKDNECPAGQVRSPDGSCLPGDGQCAAGETRGADGTCKKDSDGDGEPDEEGEGGDGEGGKGSFSGGDDCNSPPSCSGSPILCGQARIQWRIECNTRKNRNIAGGLCNAMPICTGEKCDALEYSQLLMQWRTACAAEKLAASQGNNNGGDSGQPEWTKVGGMNTDPGAGSSPSDTNVLTTKQIGIADLDQSGIGGGGSCMGFVSGGGGGSGLSSGFMEVMASPPAFFCNFIAQIRAAIILFASVACVFILSRGTA